MLAQAQGGVKSNLERREVERSVRAEPSRSWVHFGLSAKLGPSFLLSCQSLEEGEKWDPRLWLVKTSGSSSMIGSLRIKRCAGEVWLESQHSALMENIKFVQKRLFFILLWWVKLARYPLSRSLLNFWIRGWGKLLLSPLAVYKPLKRSPLLWTMRLGRTNFQPIILRLTTAGTLEIPGDSICI